jgi:hypothetical protein
MIAYCKHRKLGWISLNDQGIRRFREEPLKLLRQIKLIRVLAQNFHYIKVKKETVSN